MPTLDPARTRPRTPTAWPHTRYGRAVAFGIAAGLALAAVPAVAADVPGSPKRIVSLNICADELVLRLADPGKIASVTWLSRDGRDSNVADLAAAVPVNHGLAEEIIPLRPDLVIAGTYTTRTAVALIQRAGIAVEEMGVAASLADVRRQIREVAALVGAADAGERMVAVMDRRLALLEAATTHPRPRAIVLNPNGVTVGPGTLVDEIITMAGMTNLASELRVDNSGQVPLETVVASGADVLIVSVSRDGPPALATEMLRHPVFERLSGRMRVVVVPSRLWTCAGPAVIDAIERLRRVSNEIRGPAVAH